MVLPAVPGVPSLHALGDDAAVLQGVQIIAHHGQLRATSPLSPEHPKYLPIEHIFRTLMDLVSTYITVQVV